eukprot:TRINITY_DN33441_c0_g1_i1.p1 TRINITY_DN33441_c0_g1~~TRINITY_DN33441_c0_g1_i1.p1  ORF type:complete len:112 (-),score=46.04 TRINITY_DN33441_c0_g1_i1:34-369(-)
MSSNNKVETNDEIVHIVMWKLKEGVKDEEVQAMIEGMQRLLEIDGVTGLKVGRGFNPGRAQGWDFAMTVTLESKEALEKYAVDEIHVDVRDNVIQPLRDEVMAVDFVNGSA